MNKQEETIKHLAEENKELSLKLRYTEAKLSASELTRLTLADRLSTVAEQRDDYANSCETLEEENEKLNEQLDKAFARRDYWREEAIRGAEEAERYRCACRKLQTKLDERYIF